MIVRVKLFAVARQLAGADEIAVELPEEAAVADLRKALVDRHPPLAPVLAHVLFAVNADYANDATRIHSTDEIACIPPVSGG